ncbi:membrane protein [Glycomyces scopariae]
METPEKTPVGRVVGLSVGLALIVGLITLAFAWPSAGMGPHEVPIAVVGPDEAAAQVQDQLDQAEPDGFDVTAAADPDEARSLIEDREVYAALQIAPDGVTVYTATAASPTVARLVTGIADQIAAQTGQAAGQTVAVTVEDVVALPADDPNGAGLAASALPMAMGGIIIAALIGLSVRGTGRQIAAAVLAPPAVGAGVAAILLYVLESIEGDFWSVAGALALTMAASSWTILGLLKLLGRAGLAVGAVIVMLIGNPLSGMTAAPELLPAPWGAFGQFLTPGAGGTLVRSVAYFDGAGADTAVLTLAAWLAAGAVLFTAGAVRARVKAVGVDEREPVGATA